MLCFLNSRLPNLVTLARVAKQGFYFSNGVHVQTGEVVQAMMTPLHLDSTFYPDSLEFKPWRFYDMARAECGESEVPIGAKYGMVTPSSTFLVWGLGRHAW